MKAIDLTGWLLLCAVGGAVACSSDETPGAGTGGTGGLPDGSGSTAGIGGSGNGPATGGSGGVDVDAPFDVTIEEDDPAVCGHSAEIATDRTGSGGPGYFASLERFGASVSWIVEVPSAGSYDLGLRYASEDEARLELRVDHERGVAIELPATDDAWRTHGVRLELEAGAHHVSVVGAGGPGLVSIDALLVRGSGVAAGDCAEYAPASGVEFATPTFEDVSVHDPSVIRANGTYYVFGSHLAAAKTTDFLRWTQVASDGVNASNPLFENVLEELAEAFDYSTVESLWAADVLELENDGRFLMYYNSCEGSSPRSAMGIASASAIEGPYEDEGIFLTSGGSGYDASVLPNAIDPDAFYDPDGNLWLLYGSYSGGIYVLPLDETSGFPEQEGDYGTHLLGGNHIQIEGPFLQHGVETGYWYLFTSYGGLAAGDGYNVRVARATSPDGPYFDHASVDQATVRSAPFDASGVKLLGDHLWTHLGGSHGYVSPGHNSTWYDEASGRYFLIFHARFPGLGNFHEVRVHEMFLNGDGWPVVAPLRYAPRTPASGPERAALDYVAPSEIPGSYQFVNHGRATSGVIVNSVASTLTADGSVNGSLSGAWRFGGNGALDVEVDGTVYRGVVSRQWSEGDEEFLVTFTGVSDAGVALWGIRTGS